jgi:hypothetical protein
MDPKASGSDSSNPAASDCLMRVFEKIVLRTF